MITESREERVFREVNLISEIVRKYGPKECNPTSVAIGVFSAQSVIDIETANPKPSPSCWFDTSYRYAIRRHCNCDTTL